MLFKLMFKVIFFRLRNWFKIAVFEMQNDVYYGSTRAIHKAKNSSLNIKVLIFITYLLESPNIRIQKTFYWSLNYSTCIIYIYNFLSTFCSLAYSITELKKHSLKKLFNNLVLFCFFPGNSEEHREAEQQPGGDAEPVRDVPGGLRLEQDADGHQLAAAAGGVS
jgi:hypothetical protein